jgi:hypothetical protein
MVRSYKEVMKDSSKGWPTLDDFKERTVFFDEELIKKVLKLV